MPNESEKPDDESTVPDGEILSASEVDEADEAGVDVVDAATINDVTEKMERESELNALIHAGEATEAKYVEHELLSLFEFDLDEIPADPTFDHLRDVIEEREAPGHDSDDPISDYREEFEHFQNGNE